MVPTDAAVIVLLLALGLSLAAGGALSSIGGPTRLTIALDAGALVCGLLVLILISPVVFG